jgi:uncharacterized protein (TIGR02646 family)
MRTVKRLQKPESLRKNDVQWTKSLLDAIETAKKKGSKVPDSLYNHYKQPDILARLQEMYGNGEVCYCCYCESIIDDVSYEQIEHRMPKKMSLDKYPEGTYVWGNLHIACEKCNRSKSNKFNEKAPILDATKDNIPDHLAYKLSPTKGVYRETRSKRGITTVQHADLDRYPLRIARLKVWNETIKAIQEIIKFRSGAQAYTAKKMLRDKCDEEHGSLIGYLLDEWGLGDD